MHPSEPGAEELRSEGLVVLEPFQGYYVWADLRHVERVAVAKEMRGISDHLHNLSGAVEFFRRLERTEHEAVEGVAYLQNKREANAHIRPALQRATKSVCTAHPIDRDTVDLTSSIANDLELLKRGVTLRTIYPDSARGRQGERQWAHKVTGHGAEVRTLPDDFLRTIIVDEELAVVPDFRTMPPPRDTGFHLTHPGMVALAQAVFEQQWERATPWLGERSRQEAAGVTTPRTRRMLRLLEAGVPVTKLHERLGLSSSTIGSEMTKLYKKLEIDSLFALGAWWKTSDERNLPIEDGSEGPQAR
ncbi:hypothetical protein SMD44_07386 [Streptomyces alboflavus]|uniref:HTH luxR-type domain-containing protein n=1 Tax=Streptomyces alboflavus TaxID=67267 RepID=A0A1Z1WN77_9ACTN|nr:hypothetical protein [Streptomyces alboflavus]ARX87901.1 hypothetical protein SMD44_07386 [Streptomyces alboflavus]